MRLCFIVLVAAVALLTGTKRVLAAPKSDLVHTGRALATEHNDEEKTRGLRADHTAGEKEDEERGLFDYIVDHLTERCDGHKTMTDEVLHRPHHTIILTNKIIAM
ncbi:hypothetical protein PR003_g20756 [Phytophthora rubi]|uniref:RxLR effector protein n=1 Tax=Phytophthora rubi TaxID=129364 RepID=A0A6A3JKD0_9STRA|nr:hypothetical protein PR002_g19667 [Phytophthora rubi]KAE8995410.1 hypothetical protein PR001_g20124 [Phytophthora rubi]KAE9308385.1 hypothetical protein PR003_g20756 [Phytophthora rubi]